MNVTFHDTGPRVSRDDINRLEAVIEAPLPKEYVDFLLHTNGGIPSPDLFPIEEFEEDSVGDVQVLFRLGSEIESSDLVWNFEVFRDRLPSNLLPVGRDSGGDLICISLAGQDRGTVLFWDILDESEEPGYDNVYRIADSFSGFLDAIHDE